VQLTVEQLAALVGGQFAFDGGDRSQQITGAASIADAGEGDLTFFGNVRYLPALRRCRATAALVPLDFNESIPPIAIRVDNPSGAFTQLVARFAPPPVRPEAGVHATALIASSARVSPEASVGAMVVIGEEAAIGARTVLGSHTVVGAGARLGEECRIGPRVVIGERSVIGNRVIMHGGVVIGADGFGFEFKEGRHVKIPQTGIVQIDDDVEIGANTAIDRARFGRTWIKEGTKIDNLVQIGHNVTVGRHCILCGQVGIAGSTRIGDYVTVGGQAGIVGHIEIGDRVTLGAKSGVSKDIPAGAIYWGSPAVPMQEAKEQLAHIRRLPKLHAMVKRLQQLLDSDRKSSPPPA
jgi:UDP-3-O-[3-hydroxymyristoyl] glucosamine N-acyltransferase